MTRRVAVLVALAAILSASRADALPRFAVREGVPCTACHVNPSGGGMRNHYGRYVYETTRLAAGFLGDRATRQLLDANLGDTVSLGADARFAFIEQHAGDPAVPVNRTFVLMQADFYAAAALNGLTIYYDQGAYGSFEAMALYAFPLGPPWLSGYAKVGRFMPAYGLRLENHRTFIREEIGFGPTDKQTGAELGFNVGPLLVQLGAMNGVGAERLLDDNTEKAVVGRVEGLWRLGHLHLMAGGSIYRNQTGNVTEVAGMTVDTRTIQLRTGLHWGAALGRFAYLGEADLVWVDPVPGNMTGAKEQSFRSYQELDVLLLRGLDLTLNFEMREPDLDKASGRAFRASGGFELFPTPFVEIKVLYRHSFGSGPAETAADGYDEVIGFVHAFF